MEHFTPLRSLIGGLLIGLASASILLTQGRAIGVSGICGSLLRPVRGDVAWRIAFIIGMLSVGLLGVRSWPEAFSVAGAPAMTSAVVAGLLVGFGTRLGNGCTSGHGVCGIARLSRRSIAATLTFMTTGAIAVFVVRHLGGG